MSETPTDPAFAELKQRLQVSRGGNHPHIDWEDVFTIEPGRHSAAEHILQKVEQALDYLEKRDYGQELLRDIVLNEARTGRVTIKEAGALGSSGSPASYNTDTDEIHFHYTNNIRKKMAANEIKTYVDLILHEGGHAADIYGNVQYAEKRAALTSVEEKIRKSEIK